MVPEQDPKADLQDLIRLTDESVVLQAVALRLCFENKSDYIVALSRAGFENARIGTFLGDSTASVRSAVNRAKKADG